MQSRYSKIQSMKTFILSLVCVALFCGPLVAQDFDYSFKETYPVSSPAKLNLSSFDGNLEIMPGSGDKIEVYYIVRKGGRFTRIDRSKLEEELIVETENSSTSVSIRIKSKYENRFFNSVDRLTVGFKVYVPKATACILATSDGNVSIVGLDGHQQIRTSDGTIELSQISGDIAGKTSDGDVRIKNIKGDVDLQTSDGTIELQTIQGDVIASTSDGNIKLTKVKGDIAVKTSDGYIDFREISGSFTASTSDGNINGTVIELQKELTLKTSDGNIDVTLPGQLGLDLDIKGESIDAPFQNFTGKFEETYVRGKSNGGGIPVILSTSGGNVTVHH
jgi:DUF4097 and DUF4098 domain-containing protein YvlB